MNNLHIQTAKICIKTGSISDNDSAAAQLLMAIQQIAAVLAAVGCYCRSSGWRVARFVHKTGKLVVVVVVIDGRISRRGR